MQLDLYYCLNNLFQRYVEAKKSSKVSFPSLLLCRCVGGNHANSTEERKKKSACFSNSNVRGILKQV